MFFDIGSLEFIAIIILVILVFGPDKLPKMIQDAARVVRKIREFSDSAKRDIRSELGPEFKDFEFDDLNPRRFAKKHLLDNDELGLKEIREGLDVRKELSEVTDAINGRTPARKHTVAKKETVVKKETSVQLAKTGPVEAEAEATKVTAEKAATSEKVRFDKAGTARVRFDKEPAAPSSGPLDAGADLPPAVRRPKVPAPPFDSDAT